MPVVVDQMEIAPASVPSEGGGVPVANGSGGPAASIPDQLREALRVQRERDFRRRSH